LILDQSISSSEIAEFWSWWISTQGSMRCLPNYSWVRFLLRNASWATFVLNSRLNSWSEIDPQTSKKFIQLFLQFFIQLMGQKRYEIVGWQDFRLPEIHPCSAHCTYFKINLHILDCAKQSFTSGLPPPIPPLAHPWFGQMSHPLFNFIKLLIFDCWKQSLTRLSLPSTHPSIHPSIHPASFLDKTVLYTTFFFLAYKTV
jgi:hypothetical protein